MWLATFLAGSLYPLVGICPHHVKNSVDFIKILDRIVLHHGDMMVTFDVVSLFTTVPFKETLALLQSNFLADIIDLFQHVIPLFFLYDDQYFERKQRVAIGSLFIFFCHKYLYGIFDTNTCSCITLLQICRRYFYDLNSWTR